MQTIKELYKIGPGPSSSHTFGPMKASQDVLAKHPDADHFKIRLMGSLALTGKGHLTDKIIKKTLRPKEIEIEFDFNSRPEHPNTMTIEAFKDGKSLGIHEYISIGGGKIIIDQNKPADAREIYPHTTLDDIQAYCRKNHLRLDEYVSSIEDKDFDAYMTKIYKAMIQSVRKGLSKTGTLPGSLKLDRIAYALYESALSCDVESDKNALLLQSYAYAASEQNASGGIVVTAPTMGSCGVMPALVYHYSEDLHYPKRIILNALKTAGLIGALIQENATISGAKAGCQAEVGAACAMGAAFAASCQRLSNEQVECAAEIGLEHHLGLTCDPVGGYVMIPCIERNAVAVTRSVDAARLAKYIRNVKKNRVSFDMVVKTMNLTGKKLPMELKETSLDGLAVVVPAEEARKKLAK
ncbi:L-serine ammonia-lyase, iron-sulfur-dependent, subunit alpha [Ileibacterium valens]|uniref:L-serine ammonia-lyase n=1 Tax=Ileibacterium valens TaxID=1862668 RepID=A0A1U7ND43_9FIRM|nr:L-serine ammonia-lyase, iron-sulfur-dependent, subunit alpha [Ileibacterium valens]OLU36733.1 L-serine ammonia-lyase [Ileibacterium valens]OLU39009.1 L-serine ammonia-lyase [Erysipelotrichaceae bacterium NYU-BL-F16]OLU41226.1 L-serine ammonia-lyase [Erysipelotrichaceae bacterium NYU-BL-E8]